MKFTWKEFLAAGAAISLAILAFRCDKDKASSILDKGLDFVASLKGEFLQINSQPVAAQ